MSDSGGSGWAALLILGLGVWYCASPDDSSGNRTEISDISEAEDTPTQINDTEDDEEPRKGGETSDEYEARQEEIAGSRGTYYGDTCTVDCGGHEAGRRWAERRGIDDPDDCGGRSWSFEEGCRTYAEEQQRESVDAEY